MRFLSSILLYKQQTSTRNKAIIKACQSGGYTMKQIDEYFKVHHLEVSRIVAASKK